MTAPGVPSMRAWGRKLIHLSTAAVPVAWGYGIVDRTGVRFLLVAAVALALLVEWARRASTALQERFDATVGPMLKPEESRSITGATWLATAMLIAVLVLPGPAAVVALWAGAVGDSAAALVGRAWQVRYGRTASEKTLIGSAAGALFTGLGALWLIATPPLTALALGVVAAAAEWPRRFGDDNLRVTLAVGVAAWFIGVG